MPRVVAPFSAGWPNRFISGSLPPLFGLNFGVCNFEPGIRVIGALEFPISSGAGGNSRFFLICGFEKFIPAEIENSVHCFINTEKSAEEIFQFDSAECNCGVSDFQ